MSHYKDVNEFFEKFDFRKNEKPGHLTKEDIQRRIDFMQEELDEIINAKNIDDIADGLIDLVYVAIGTAIKMGLPWEELWDDVHRANMSKERGLTKRGYSEDCYKPDGWIGPKTREILKKYE